MASALDGLTVLDLGTGAACAMAAMFLGDNGARVIRLVQPPSNRAERTPHLREGGFIVWDRGKACVPVDLQAAQAGERSSGEQSGKGSAGAAAAADLDSLIARADVLIEDFAPSSPLQALVARARLARINPRLVSCSITGWGKHGPMQHE